MKLEAVYAVAVLAAAVGACNRDRGREHDRSSEPTSARTMDPNEQDKAGTTTLTGATWVANEAAIDRIVASRCAREVACSHVGVDRHFTTSDVCVREVRSRTTADLAASECPSGIDGKELDECLDAIRNESCSNAMETLGRLAACRTSELCLKTPIPHR